MDQAINYGQLHSNFSNAYGVGLSSNPNAIHADNPTAMNPAIQDFQVQPNYNFAFNSGCPENGYVFAQLDASKMGFPSSYGPIYRMLL